MDESSRRAIGVMERYIHLASQEGDPDIIDALYLRRKIRDRGFDGEHMNYLRMQAFRVKRKEKALSWLS